MKYLALMAVLGVVYGNHFVGAGPNDGRGSRGSPSENRGSSYPYA